MKEVSSIQMDGDIVNLELALELKGLGFPQESLFYWLNAEEWELTDSGHVGASDVYASAYLLTEMIELLGEEIKRRLVIDYNGSLGEWNVVVSAFVSPTYICDTNICNVFAQLLINLKKEGRI